MKYPVHDCGILNSQYYIWIRSGKHGSQKKPFEFFHPDRNQEEGSKEKFQAISEAYEKNRFNQDDFRPAKSCIKNEDNEEDEDMEDEDNEKVLQRFEL